MRPISIAEKRAELRRVLESRHFAKAPKKSRFLEFICDQGFDGRAEETNEYTVGVEVYERGESFNPHEDSIVRVQAHEIRRSLKEFYSREGRDSQIRIDLPPGHYVPRFTRISEPVPRLEGGEAAQSNTAIPWLPWVVSACLALVAVIFGSLLVRERTAARDPSPSPWSAAYSAEMDWFWKPFLPPAPRPLVVVPVHPLLRAVHDGDTETTRSGGFLISKAELPEFRHTIHYRELGEFRFVPSTTDFTAVGETLGLIRLFDLFASQQQSVRVEAARLVDFGEVERNNTILLGGNQAWSGRIYLYPEGFRLMDGTIANGEPRPKEKKTYRAEFDPLTNDLRKDYALILMLPNERRENRILLIYGIYTQGSQAAIEFVTSRAGLHALGQSLAAETPEGEGPPDYFQALLETTVENGVPGKTSIVAVRVIPVG